MLAATLASLVALLAVPANAFFILSHPVLETTRLDSIVSPGQIGGHVHSIVGGSAFNRTQTYESMIASKCTTAAVTIDKSNYWTPQLYYYDPSDQSYTGIPVAFVNTYYLNRPGPGETTVQAPPKGLRILQGDPFRRTFNASSFDDQSVSFVCLDYSGQHRNDPDWDQRNDFFTHGCPDGLRAQINFPNCWDGVNLDSPDHRSHMAWPTGGVNGGGTCPPSHPVHLVQVFYEFVYNTGQFPFNAAGTPTWVFSNGDTTGYGMHGDFIAGWDEPNGVNVLQQAIDGCNANNGVGGELQNCPPFVPFLDSAAASACRPENPLVNEDVGIGHKIARLPGNNPLWVGTGPKPSWPGFVDINDYISPQSPIPAGYTLTGCVAEATSGRALTGASFANNNMTRGACVSWCADRGFPYAGVEYGRECYCDTQLRNGATTATVSDSQCQIACANNPNENCGGRGTLDLFYNAGKVPTDPTPKGWTATGCRTEATNTRALSGYSFTADNMTWPSCLDTCQAKGFQLAGVEWSRECYCGNSYNNGSVPAPATDCNMPCAGDALHTCGGSRRLTTWSFGATAAKRDIASRRALRDVIAQ
ncbi:hypothetical protein Q8F55_001463 [Vanrija albida]|uniref:WSC domain-containing protein n=1 Tax=Vanrija albida TaxID=181172 RepID=A0ABR3QG57_9TREE